MMEDPENLRQGIEHYQHLLTLHSSASSREQVLQLLDKAKAQLCRQLQPPPRSQETLTQS